MDNTNKLPIKDKFIAEISDKQGLIETLNKETLTVYGGFDPSANSLHIGNLCLLVNLKRFAQKGNKLLVLVGTATGVIGDPSFRDSERKLLTVEEVMSNAACLQKQIEKFFGLQNIPITIVKNHEWFKSINCMEFLRDIGKYFSVNSMINRESVRSRLERREQGISYTEFSYMLLQAYDYYYLNQKYDCRLQLGGSDQWGNILGGVDYTKRKLGPDGKPIFALATPLLLRQDGVKFGKSEGGANVWLDPDKTSPFKMYQFFLNSSDTEVINLLEVYTETSENELTDFKNDIEKHPEKRNAQKFLARQVVGMVHGEEEAIKAEKASISLFTKGVKSLDIELLLEANKDLPSIEISETQLNEKLSIIDILVDTKLCSSKTSAKKLIASGGCYLNEERITELDKTLELKDFIAGKACILQSGKKNKVLIKLNQN